MATTKKTQKTTRRPPSIPTHKGASEVIHIRAPRSEMRVLRKAKANIPVIVREAIARAAWAAERDVLSEQTRR